jgi:hypothetical protein
MKQPNEILLKLPVEVLDQIGKILEAQPYREVAGILNLIVSQANDPALQAWRPPSKPKTKA